MKRMYFLARDVPAASQVVDEIQSRVSRTVSEARAEWLEPLVPPSP